jgi:hypothetical protein
MPINYENLYKSPATEKQRIETALRTLAGIIEGIVCDKALNEDELRFLRHWMDENQRIAEKHPVKELFHYTTNATIDGILSEDEKNDILHGIDRIISGNYYGLIVSMMQRLHGILAGVASDRVINETEMKHVLNWIDDHSDLKSHWPYDETESMIHEMLKDRKIDPVENERFLSFCSQFVPLSEAKTLDKHGIHGVVSINPDIEFNGRQFSVTGDSHKATRKEIIQAIQSKDGIFVDAISRNTDYLIYCNGGTKCWTYSCYGRKIEAAMSLRKNGHTVQIIAEGDFWDVLVK